MRRLFAQWEQEDYKEMPPKAYLLESHVQQFCCECIWFNLNQTEPTFDCKLFILHAIVLRLQSATNSRKVNLSELEWRDLVRVRRDGLIQNGYAWGACRHPPPVASG